MFFVSLTSYFMHALVRQTSDENSKLIFIYLMFYGYLFSTTRVDTILMNLLFYVILGASANIGKDKVAYVTPTLLECA